MKGFILINAFSGIGEHQASRLREEFAKLGFDVLIVRNEVGAIPSNADFCVFLDKDLYTAKSLENRGVRLFNSSEAIALCDDKMLTYLALEGVVNQPLTIPSSFAYSDAPISDNELNYLEEMLGYPMALKINKQSRGEGVFLVKDREELNAYVTRFRTIPHLYQKFISFSSGRDTRVIVVGSRVICAMERVNEHDFRSNVEQGGVGKAVTISQEMQKMAIEVSQKLGLEYCGIDFLMDENGVIYVIEVNSNAFFKGIEGATGVSVAGAYARHILSVLQG